MVHWTENEIAGIAKWNTLDYEKLVARSLKRMFTVFPWTQRYFEKRDKFTVEIHAMKVSGKITEVIKDLTKIKSNCSALSKFHADILHVDSGSFHLLTDCIIVELAILNFGTFNPKVHAIWHKFFAVLVDAISKQYH
ncbi:hemoglobin subunit beta-like [Chiloscyllium punctatum]|uniref:hemoglobin subunit beta-like n=1 Tax=Chiloscyllium punctatum TaxID=137246 RepID=UPI003B63B91E